MRAARAVEAFSAGLDLARPIGAGPRWSSRSPAPRWSSSRAIRGRRAEDRLESVPVLLDGLKPRSSVDCTARLQPPRRFFQWRVRCPTVRPAATRGPSPLSRYREAISSFGPAKRRIHSSLSAPGRSSCFAAARRTAGWPSSPPGICAARIPRSRARCARTTHGPYLRHPPPRDRGDVPGPRSRATRARRRGHQLDSGAAAPGAGGLPDDGAAVQTGAARRTPASCTSSPVRSFRFPTQPTPSSAVPIPAQVPARGRIVLGRCPSLPQPTSRRHQAAGERLSGCRGAAVWRTARSSTGRASARVSRYRSRRGMKYPSD